MMAGKSGKILSALSKLAKGSTDEIEGLTDEELKRAIETAGEALQSRGWEIDQVGFMGAGKRLLSDIDR